MNIRAGYYMQNTYGYKSFVPASLPPNPEILLDWEMQELLSQADRKLGRLDGITEILPNPDLFLAMYVNKEALLSSQIEGTQASFVDVLEFDESNSEAKVNTADVVNYVKALRYGLDRIKSLPLSLRLIREIHKVLIEGTRGSEKDPGEFRKTQNWIGPQGSTPSTATFVPPDVKTMEAAMNELELFLYDSDSHLPPLIKIALIHAQFETIHPFLDGNGRMGRLLITFWLCQQKILSQPLLYLSYYFKQNRTEYYDRLMDVRNKGAWEAWIKFFLKGVAEVSDESIYTAKEIISLKNSYSKALYELDSNNSNFQRLLDFLFDNPIITRKQVCEALGVSNPTAGILLGVFCDLQILEDFTPHRQRNKKYSFGKYISVLNRGTEPL